MKKNLLIILISFIAIGIILIFSNSAFIFLFNDKIWAHRVNSIEKKKEVSNKFSGIEVDLVYDQTKNIFDVNHPPAVSINLSLYEYLQANPNTNIGYWLDYKNLESVNAEKSVNLLDSIITTLNLNKNNIIVESKNYKPLKPFENKGFKISYYLPSLHQMKNDSLSQTIEDIKIALKTFPNMYISSNYKDYKLMKEHFPLQNKLLWWKGKKTFWSWRNRLNLFRILNDKTVKVLLVPYKTKTGER